MKTAVRSTGFKHLPFDAHILNIVMLTDIYKKTNGTTKVWSNAIKIKMNDVTTELVTC